MPCYLPQSHCGVVGVLDIVLPVLEEMGTSATKGGSTQKSEELVAAAALPVPDVGAINEISYDFGYAQSQQYEDSEKLNVSFGYQCQWSASGDCLVSSAPDSAEGSPERPKRAGMFSCLSGAAMGANATLANTKICNGIFEEEILPGLDSPHTFRRLVSSFSTSKLDSLMSSKGSSSLPSKVGLVQKDHRSIPESASAPDMMGNAWLLNADDIQMAGGAAGEDRVQAVCSEENGWLFCGIYDGFNGRDAADYLAGTLYENIGLQLRLLEWRRQQQQQQNESVEEVSEGISSRYDSEQAPKEKEAFQSSVLEGLKRALVQTESDFLEMTEQEMDDRLDLAMVGSCVLVALMHGNTLYILNMGDSRAILATQRAGSSTLGAVQLTETHDLENDAERQRILQEHPDDASPIAGGRVKGKLKVTRAFGAGFLKKASMNNSLMGILRVRNLCSPPYISASPHVRMHNVSALDRFVVLGSDGLFDFFSNDEVVELVQSFISEFPAEDPAKYMLDQLVLRAADSAGMSVDQLKSIPIGRRRKYHDDVTIIVVLLGSEFRTSSASTLS